MSKKPRRIKIVILVTSIKQHLLDKGDTTDMGHYKH